MTSNIGKPKRQKNKFQFLNKKGARSHRKEFIETSYVNGVYSDFGDLVIRPLNKEEISFLDSYYKEFVHGTFKTDDESKALFKKARSLTKKKENVDFFKENGFFPEEVQSVIDKFNAKSKALGNIVGDFWSQKEINSDDHKRRFDIQNNCTKGVRLESFEDIQNVSDFEDKADTTIEDLVTESEK